MLNTLKTEDFVFNKQYDKVNKLLEHSTLILNTVLQTSANAVVIFDKNGDLVYLNKNAFKALGTDTNEVNKQTINLYNLLEDPDDARRIFNKGEAVEVITTINLNDNVTSEEARRYKIRCMAIPVDDKIIAYIGVIADITIEKIQENKINYQADQIKLLNTYIDHTLHESRVSLWKFTYEDDECTKIRGEIIMGITNLSFKTIFDYQDFIDIFSEKNMAELKEIERKHLLEENLNKSIISHMEIETPVYDNSVFIKIASVRINEPNGRPQIIAAIHNITDIMLQKIELERSNTKLEQLLVELNDAKSKAVNADRLKSQFLANMSHEIRTPLNAIVGFADLLTEKCTEEQKAKWQKHIYHNSDMLTRLIDDILDLSKIESGNINITESVFDFSSYFNDVTASIKEKRIKTNVDFIVVNPFSKFIVKADQSRLTQIINNFTSNAIKHTTEGSITVGYKLDDSLLTMYVKDTGKGISEENLKKVFGRFEKLDDLTQGTGLGLAIVKAIVDEMGGDCGCTSKLGKGSYFWASVNVNFIDKTNVDNELLRLNNSDYTDPYAPLPKHLKVLVAEDSESNFVLVESMLGPCNITRAENGAEAVELAKKHKYNIMLMDIRMQKMNGYDAIRAIREFDSITPIVVLTANIFSSDEKYAYEIGANDFITKPIKRDKLIQSVIKYTSI